MARWCIPLTYKPKIEAVFAGTCRQTIRKGTKFSVGDVVTIYEWTGKPRHSKWGRRMKVRLVRVQLVVCNERGFGDWLWVSPVAGFCAWDDGIEPPTGEALRDVLKKLNGPAWEGVYQAISW